MTFSDKTSPAALDAGLIGGRRQTPLALGPMILVLASSLLLLGVVMVFSASSSLDRAVPENILHFIPLRQGIFAGAGLLLMWVSYGIGYHCCRWRPAQPPGFILGTPAAEFQPWYRQPAALLALLSVLALVAVWVPGVGVERHGARRWLQFGPPQYGIGFQPSELAKLTVIILLAAWLSVRRQRMPQFVGGLLPPATVLAIVAGLIVLEDLGTAALLVVVGGMITLAAGARWWHALILAQPGIVAFACMILLKPYRVERLLSFRNIWDDPHGQGYHAIQSLIAIASGDWLGRGLGAGLQKYGYLPEAQTDFIFAIICEELGILGGLAVLGLFACLVLFGARVALQAPDHFGKLMALGVTLMIGFQAALNIAVVTVSVPTKGISLPLVSSGGSGIIIYSVAIGLLASVSRRTSRCVHNLDS